MQNIQEIFNRMQDLTKKQKDIKSAFRDALKQSTEYQEIDQKMQALRIRKKQIEGAIKADFSGELTKLDDIKIDMESDRELLTDAAVTQMMKGETVEVTDEYNNKYSPVFTVKFKKT